MYQEKVKLLIFDSHPVQYRVPIWQRINKKYPNILHVIYASDCSVQGYNDVGFGKSFSWDEPMLEGYTFSILNNENGLPLTGWNSLIGNGVWNILSQHKPQAVLMTGLNYRYDLTVLIYSKIKGIPIWLRCETQDFAIERTETKALIRSFIYKFVYIFIDKFFYIGELNKIHYLVHGIDEKKLFLAKYCTIDRYVGINEIQKNEIRKQLRREYGLNDDSIVIGFSGKFIAKKNPKILFEMLPYLPRETQNRIVLYFIGSGKLEEELKQESLKVKTKYGVTCIFTGFINQSKIGLHYLAIDIFVLPSKRMGETWGLVVNEAMQAGCSIIISDAVGCGEDFKNIERVRVFKEGDAKELAEKVKDVIPFERNFHWANSILKDYSIDSAADSLVSQIF